MRGILVGVVTLVLLGSVSDSAQAQKKLLPSTGWGSLSGKVTLAASAEGDPAVANLVPTMMKHADAACCLAGKPLEKVDMTWIVNPKTKAVANVAVWVKAPVGSYFPIHEKFKVRKEEVVLDQPHCAFLPRIAAFNPVYFDGEKEVQTGQKLTIKNSATVSHNIRATGNPKYNPGFNVNLPAGAEISKTFVPQFLPVNMQCDIHPWMGAKLFVFDHPYYAITKEDGSYEIPYVPAGAEVSIMAWHEGVGYVLTKDGSKKTLSEGKNTFDFEVKR